MVSGGIMKIYVAINNYIMTHSSAGSGSSNSSSSDSSSDSNSGSSNNGGSNNGNQRPTPPPPPKQRTPAENRRARNEFKNNGSSRLLAYFPHILDRISRQFPQPAAGSWMGGYSGVSSSIRRSDCNSQALSSFFALR
jgi:hypothetical protein